MQLRIYGVGNRKDIGRTLTTAENSSPRLQKTNKSILLISALGILLAAPKSSNGYPWPSFPFFELTSFKGGEAMIRQQGGFKDAIKKAFPEADFSQWSNSTPSQAFSILFPGIDIYCYCNTEILRERFQEIKNCREAFLRYAEEKGFDPLQEENWYHIKSSDFLHELKVNCISLP